MFSTLKVSYDKKTQVHFYGQTNTARQGLCNSVRMGCLMCSAQSQETHAFLNNDTKIAANTTGNPMNENAT